MAGTVQLLSGRKALTCGYARASANRCTASDTTGTGTTGTGMTGCA